MCASYARQHQKKLQFVQNQFSSVGGNTRQRLSSEERRHLLSDKDAYIEYLETQLDKVCELSLVENPQIQKRVQELEQSITDHEEKFANITKLIKLLQTFAENQEDENKLIKEHFNKPLNSFGKKIENFQNDLVSELKDQIIKIEEKDGQRESQIYETLSAFQKNINDFEVRIEQFANQLSKDMATDIKMLATQIQGEANSQNTASIQPDQLRNFPIVSDNQVKQNLDKFREEINKKIEFVLKEMRKNALLTDVECVETKLKKEQKERTYLCKFVEDLTRKIDELPQSITTRASTSRNVSPSAVQESNQFKLVKQIESDIEDLKEVVNALVDKIEEQDKKKKSSFITKDQFDSLEKNLTLQISRFVDRFQNFQANPSQNVAYDESLRESDNQRSNNNFSARQQYSTLKSDQYLTQQMRSPQFEQQGWQQQQMLQQNQYQLNNQSAEIHPEDDSYMMQQKYSPIIQDDQDLRDTLISKKDKNTSLNNQQSGGDNNLGESFGLNQNSHISNNLSDKLDQNKNKSRKKSSNQEEILDQYPQREKRGVASSSSKSITRQSDKENKQNSNSQNRGRKATDESVTTLKKNKKRELKSESKSMSKSPSNIGEVSSTKSINASRKLSQQNISIDRQSKSNTRVTLTEPEETRIKSPLSNISKNKSGFESNQKSKIKNKSPSPIGNTNKFAEKKRQNGEKIKELFKKKKQMDQNSSSHTNQNHSISQKSANISVNEKKQGDKKKK
ncbi:hypothetical protein TTHERM_00257170 (macronuclear) [Tetrahymena thermophila SB210]|uniref:Uncharacterized protein n=1 Tax=Tetrahymena thermophila (strain SB210) TaxID=312017 RepID=Q23QG1_TETTS|nr:hypothetical protein TTHERM_00257170 [Tetrahymena thermophila SB210]EAR98927.2 hypothetical protein TTHERM_00257170 [Tetrahymena thermophila SB210]|eukprot:XP_001019172.2 hypothetical protein TTHERM_00257170 [Tetrahymena thermophila SB210]